MKNLKKIGMIFAGWGIALSLTACGDDVTEQVTEQIYSTVESVGSVDSKKDLPECTKDLAGQTAFVKNPGEFFGCDGESWRQLGNNSVSFGDNFCYSEELKDEEGFEIFCNKVSLGKVFNGEDGKDGKDGSAGSNGAPGSAGSKGDKGKPGDGCKMIDKQADSLKVVIQCGTETFAMNLSGLVTLSECEEGDTDCADPQGDVQLSGQSQKGPYVSGTDVSAYELLDGKSLKQTGNMFAGKIEREDGLFNIKTVKLSSQYTYLVADGFYRNEVTGKVSNTTLKLRALANLKRKNTANINLITHLEYDRASNLVTGKTQMKVMDAKKQAEKEILKAFHIDTTILKSSEYAEDLNILTKSSSANGALLAISVMLQGDRNVAELTPILASFSVDLGMDGKWDNEEVRAEIADWALQKDMSKEGFASIKKNIENWKIDNTVVPEFVQHTRNFWHKELGFDECSSKNVGTVVASRNPNSAFYAAKDSAYTEGDSTLARLICAVSGTGENATYAWRYATDLEKDVAALPKDAAQGAVSLGNINTSYVYVFENSAWRRGTELDSTLSHSCLNLKGILGSTDSLREGLVLNWYKCDNSKLVLNGDSIYTAWRLATTAEADTAGFGVPESNIARIGNINKERYYVFEINSETKEGAWRYGTVYDVDKGLGPCVKTDLGAIRKLNGIEGDNAWFRCVNDEVERVEGVLVPYVWRKATISERDTTGWNKVSAQIGDIKNGNLTNRVFVYDEDAKGQSNWRYGSALDTLLKQACIKSKSQTPDTSSQKVRDIGSKEERYFVCTKQEMDSIPYKWVDAGDWYNETVEERAKCNGGNASVGTLMTGKMSNYICTKEASWQIPANRIDSTLSGCRESIKDSVGYADKKYRYCDNTNGNWEWREAKKIEYDTYRWNETYKNPKDGDAHEGNVTKNSYYVYDEGMGNTWIDRSDETIRDYKLRGCTQNRAAIGYSIIALDEDKYKCIEFSTGVYRWSILMQDDNLDGVTCPLNKLYQKPRTSTYYACDGDYFREATAFEVKYGPCVQSFKDSVIAAEGKYWKCDGVDWIVTDQFTFDTYKRTCPAKGEYYQAPASGIVYSCKEGRFVIESTFIQDTYGVACPVDGEFYTSPKSGEKYGCKNGTYVIPDKLDLLFNKICSNSSLTHTYNGVQYQCNESLDWAETSGYKRAVFLDSRDLTIYPMVTIGTQTWMAKNLNYSYNYGTTWSLCYNRDPQNCETYGLLYKWSTAMDSAGVFSDNSKNCGYGRKCTFSNPVRGICPEGWHLPTRNESNLLVTNAGGSAAAVNLAAVSETLGTKKGVDKYGFSMLLAGHRNTDASGEFFYLGKSAYFISADQYESDNTQTYRWGVANGATVFDVDVRKRYFGYSIRCIKD